MSGVAIVVAAAAVAVVAALLVVVAAVVAVVAAAVSYCLKLLTLRRSSRGSLSLRIESSN